MTALHPDGQVVAVAGGDGIVRLRAVVGSAEERVVAHSSAGVIALAWSPDGTKLASTDRQGHLAIHVPDRSSLSHRIDQQSRAIHAMAFTADGSELLAVGQDRRLRCWNVASGRLTRSSEAFSGCLYAVAASPDGRWIAVAGLDAIIHLIDARTQEPFCDLTGHAEAIYDLAFTADGRLASVSEDGTARMWDLPLQACVLIMNAHEPLTQLSLSSDGRRMSTIGPAGRVIVWNPSTGEVIMCHGGVIPGWGRLLSTGERIVVSPDRCVKLPAWAR